MRSISFEASTLSKHLKNVKIANMQELKLVLGSDSKMTVFRKLKQLNYISSSSHGGSFYTLKSIVRFNEDGLWFCNSVLFSKYKNLVETIKALIEKSRCGLTAQELEKKLKIKPAEVLLKLITGKKAQRKKIDGRFVYFSNIKKQYMSQELLRNEPGATKSKSEAPIDEVKATIILFYSTLDEKQRRLFAGLESMRKGSRSDSMIADLLGLNIKTVTKGRKELLEQNTLTQSVRGKGAGRKTLFKKRK